MKPPAPTHFNPNRLGRVVLLAMEEIIGRERAHAILKLASLPVNTGNSPTCDLDPKFPFDTVSRLQSALEREYGRGGGRGLALQTGRACFKYGLREFSLELGLTDLSFRLLPQPVKLKTASKAFASLFNQCNDPRVRLEFDEKHITWHIERCPLCWGRQADSPCCSLAVGLLQEAFYWVSGGKFFLVEETECIACGDPACTIVIDQVPIQ